MITKTLQTLNVPIELIEKVQEKAKLDGLSSVHDIVRILLRKYGEGEISISVKTTITPEQARRYLTEGEIAQKEVLEGKRKVYSKVEDMMQDLNKPANHNQKFLSSDTMP